MARDFDGTNDNISYGTDATIDGFTTITHSMWVQSDAQNVAAQILSTKESTLDGFSLADYGNNKLGFIAAWSTTNGLWETTTGIGLTTTHVAVTYDAGATANDPVIYINGVADTFVTDANPTGTRTSDAGNNLLQGENSLGGADLNGRIAFYCYDNTVWTAAEVNRARWWGRPKGGLQVYHPLLTSKLANEGAATANGTATGTTVAQLVTPVQVPGTAMMGAMVGW